MISEKKMTLSEINHKATEIRRNKKDFFLTNYCGFCNTYSEVPALCGKQTIIFWADENGDCRVFFYTSSPDEFVELLPLAPADGSIDYISRNPGEYQSLFEKAGWHKFATLKRFTRCFADDRIDQEFSAESIDLFHKIENCMHSKLPSFNSARLAQLSDLDALMEKIPEVFSTREIHMISRDQLAQFIQEKSVSVYYEGCELKAFYIMHFIGRSVYDYLLWNSSHPGALASITLHSFQLRLDYNQKLAPAYITRHYFWINTSNASSLRYHALFSISPDGLYDDMYCK